jgi:hypothetical protein
MRGASFDGNIRRVRLDLDAVPPRGFLAIILLIRKVWGLLLAQCRELRLPDAVNF